MNSKQTRKRNTHIAEVLTGTPIKVQQEGKMTKNENQWQMSSQEDVSEI
jgi:hypothetical protein